MNDGPLLVCSCGGKRDVSTCAVHGQALRRTVWGPGRHIFIGTIWRWCVKCGGRFDDPLHTWDHVSLQPEKR